MFCCIGNYSVNNNPVDVYLCAALGVLGYVLAKLECEPAPLLLGYVLGPLMEEHLRRAMLLSRGDPSVFFTRPISLAFMIGTALVLFAMIWPALRRRKSAELKKVAISLVDGSMPINSCARHKFRRAPAQPHTARQKAPQHKRNSSSPR